MTSTTEIQNFVAIFQNIEIINTFIKILDNRTANQLKAKFVIIDVEKRQIHLRHKLTQIEIEREIDFFIVSISIIETKRYRSDFDMQTTLSLKKKFKIQNSKVYFENIPKFFDKYIRKSVNTFDFKSNIYQVDKTKILFASKYLFHAIFND